MNATLEATARALFKSWFVDFDPVRAKAEGRDPDGMDAATAALFPASFDESELGLIPSGWRVGTIEEFCDLKYGKFISKKDLVDGSYPVYSGYSIVGYHTAYIYEEPQIIVVCRGVGGSGDVKMSPPWSWITNLSIVVTPKDKDALIKQYLYRILTTKDLTEIISGSAQYQITIAHLQDIPILIAPPQIQYLISQFEKLLTDKISINEKNNTTLVATRDALLPRLMSGEIRVGEVEV